MLQTKASADAVNWASKKKEAMERAKKIREDKKFGMEAAGNEPESKEIGILQKGNPNFWKKKKTSKIRKKGV